MTAALLVSLTMLSHPAVPRETTHPDTCRACASSSSEAKAARDLYLIRTGVFEGPTVSDRFVE